MESFTGIVLLLLILPASCTASENGDFYSLTAKDIQGNEMSLEQYKGKVNFNSHEWIMFWFVSLAADMHCRCL